MTIDELTNVQESILAKELREIYYNAEIEGTNDDKSQFLSSIITLVNESNKTQRDYFQAHPDTSFAFSTVHDLCALFIEKYKTVLSSAERFAYSINDQFGYTVDITSVVCPFLLSQFGVTNEFLSFYIGLGMTITGIIIDGLANKEARRREKLNEKQIITLCTVLKNKLEDAQKANLSSEERAALEKSIVELEKISNSK